MREYVKDFWLPALWWLAAAGAFYLTAIGIRLSDIAVRAVVLAAYTALAVWSTRIAIRERARERREPLGTLMHVVISNFGPAEAEAPPPPPPPLPVRRQTGPIVAWRAWDLVVRRGQPRLRSVTAYVEWEGPILRAGGKPAERLWLHHGAVPAMQGDYGIFAYNAPDRQELLLSAVMGEVELFGRVVRHELGYRAEAARIRKLYLTREWVSFGGSWIMSAMLHGRDIHAPCELPASFFIEPLASLYQCDVALHPNAERSIRGNR